MISDGLAGQYDGEMVALSLVIAICASSAAFYLEGRTSDLCGKAHGLWFAAGSPSMGLGIWPTHSSDLLACQLPMTGSHPLPVGSPNLGIISILLVTLAVFAMTLVGLMRIAGSSCSGSYSTQNWSVGVC